MVEKVGFEPTGPIRITVLQTAATLQLRRFSVREVASITYVFHNLPNKNKTKITIKTIPTTEPPPAVPQF